ncbi:LysR family transcriptional regulator [Pseudochelatococcus lubricantis]|uniref:LysR family transcriptional regulator n=1 Tax=Pseudochelatococcus lubricantis TaxID=1538102 RepID=UPI0035EE6372
MIDRQRRVQSPLGSRIPLASLIQTLAVAEYLNFRHAADAMGVSQSSVSARVKTLEEDLGILLFERHARGVRLTEAGRHFVERVAAGIDQLDHAVRTAGMVARGEHGRLRIGVHALIPGGFLVNLLNRYREEYSGVETELVEESARKALMQVRSGELDAAFVMGTPEPPDCHSRRLWTEPLLVALPKRHRLVGRSAVTWTELAEETFLVRRGGTGPQVHDHIVLRLTGRGLTPSIQRFDVGRSALLSMVGQSFGITIVGAAASVLPTAGVVFASISDEPEPLTFSVVWSPYNQSQTLRHLLDLATRMGRAAKP